MCIYMCVLYEMNASSFLKILSLAHLCCCHSFDNNHSANYIIIRRKYEIRNVITHQSFVINKPVGIKNLNLIHDWVCIMILYTYYLH